MTEEGGENMKTSNRRKLIICVLLAVLILPAALAYAYFTDYEEAVGGAVIHLDGETRIYEEAEDDKKTVQVENVGETDVIVRIAIFGEFITETAVEPDDWDQDGEYWYYRYILHPGERTSEIVATIDITAAEAAGHDFEIIVVHESARVVYDGTPENNVVLPDGWTYPAISLGM